MDLEQEATKSLYVQRFSEKTNINEDLVREELRRRDDRRPESRDTSQLKRRLLSGQDLRKYGSDLQFLNLLVHYPETIDTFRDQEWGLIVSDPEIIKIIRILMEKSPSGGDLDLNRIEESLDSPKAKEQLRRLLMSKPIYSDESVGQAVDEFVRKIARVKITQSFRKASAEGDIETLDRLIKAKQALDLPSREN
jgi:hypothetical protein